MPHINVNGANLHYRFDGNEHDPVILLSNSLASNLHMWDPQIDALVEAGFRVLRYDSRGMGQSEVTAGPYTIEQLADDAFGLLEALEIGRVHYCGLSKGGMVGQMLGTRHAKRFKSLTLCDTAAYMGPAEMWEERIAVAQANGMASTVTATLERWITPAGQARLPEAVAQIGEMISTTAVEGYAACCRAIASMDQRESIKAITIPTLVIVGEDDPGTPVSAAELIAERIPGARLCVLSEAAHLANIEQPEAFNQALLGFLATNR